MTLIQALRRIGALRLAVGAVVVSLATGLCLWQIAEACADIRYLTVYVQGVGRVTTSPPGTNVDGNASSTVTRTFACAPGTAITLTATALTPGWRFDHWNNETASTNTKQVTVSSDTSVTAVFKPDIKFQAEESSVFESVGRASVIVTRPGSGIATTVNYEVSASSSAKSGDYTLASGPLSFSASDTSKPIYFDIVDDLLDEEDIESIIVSLTGASNGVVGAPSTHTLRITDNDSPPTIYWSLSTSSISETAAPEGIVANVACSLSALSGREVSAGYSISDISATLGVDYTFTGAPLTFSPGQIQANVPIRVLYDALDEEPESISLTLGAPTNATLATPSSHVLTLGDDDPPPTIQFVNSASEIYEADSEVTLALNLQPVSGKTITLHYTVDGTARGGGRDFLIGAGQLEISAGGTGSIPIHIMDDLIYESNETIVVHLTSATNAEVGPMNTYTLTIADNDPAPTVEFMEGQIEPLEVIYEDDGDVLLLVSLTGDTESIATVDYSIATTAQWGGVEPSARNGTITFDPDAFFSNIGLIRVPLVDDDVHGDYETVTVTLTNPQNATLGERDEIGFWVFDDDPTPRMRFAEATSEATEDPQVGNIVNVVLDHPSADEVDVWVSVAGNATGYGIDHYMMPLWVRVLPGEYSSSIVIPIAGDVLDEDPETIELSLSEPENAELSSPINHIVTIVDDDPVPGIRWVNESLEVEELDGHLQIPFELTEASGRDVQMYFTHSAIVEPNPEYAFTPCPVTIPAGSLNGQVTLTIAQDELLEPTEVLSVYLLPHPLMNAAPTAPAVCQVSVLDALRLTVTQPEEGGTITAYPPGPLYKRGAAVTLYATSLAGWRFGHWTGDFTSNTTPLDLVLLENKSVSAQFIRQYSLIANVSPAGAGTVTASPSDNPHDIGSTVTLTAEPAPHYRFDHWMEVNDDWTNTIIGTIPTTTVVMDKDRIVYAVFQHQFTLTTVAIGGGALTPESGDFDEGTEVTLDAVANPGFEFIEWFGPVHDITVSEDPATGGLQSSQAKVLMDADKTVEALFAESWGYALEVTCDGLGSVTPNRGRYAPGQEVTLYATAMPGWYFDHWTGDLSGSENPVTITMDGPKQIIAVFLMDSPYDDEVVVNTEVIGRGKILPSELKVPAFWVTGSPSGPPPEVYMLFTAQAEEGARFDHWSGGIEGNENPGKFRPYHYPHIVATFVDICNVEITVEGEGAVMPGTGEYGVGVPATFTGMPAAGFRFHHWVVNGQEAGTDPTLTITPDGDTNVQAVFTRVAALTVLSMPGAVGGSITVDPLKGAYDPGDHVSLLAAPAEAWRFYRWEKNGAYAGEVNPLPLTVQGDTTVAAWFIQTFEFTATATAGGSVYPTHKTCDIGTTVAATATPEAGRVFVRWDGDVPEDLRYRRHVVLTMDQNRTIQPVFGYALTASILGGGAIRIGDATAPLVTGAQTLRNIPLGQEVTLTAVDTENATFQHWIMPDGSLNTSAIIQVTLSESSTLSAVFEPAETSPTGNVSLAVAVNGGGKVTVNAQGDKAVRNYGVFSYAPNSSVALTATPDEGYVFSHWSGDATGPNASLSVAMDGPKAVTAHFHASGQTTTPEGNDLSVRVIGGGTVVSNGWWFPIPGEDEEPPLAIVIAKPNFGWRFDHWEGDSTDTRNITGAIMDADRSLTAVFVPGLTLDVSAIVAGGNVYVGAEEDWIPEMPDALNAGFAPGQEAQFTAVPQDGWEFDHWIGLPAAYTSQFKSPTVTMQMPSHVSAQPVFVPLYPVTVGTPAVGSVTIVEEGRPDGTVTANQLVLRRPGTRFTITAIPPPGWRLNGWRGPVMPSDDPGTPNTVTLAVSEPTVVMPRFAPIPFKVTATSNYPDGAEVRITPEKEEYLFGDVVELSVITKPGCRFVRWDSPGIEGAETRNPLLIAVHGDISVVAQIEGTFQITRPSNSAYYVAEPAGPYFPGQTVTLTVPEIPGNSFDHWEGDLSGNENPAIIDMQSDRTISALVVEQDFNRYKIEFGYANGGTLHFYPPPTTMNVSESISYRREGDIVWQFYSGQQLIQWDPVSGKRSVLELSITGTPSIAGYSDWYFTGTITSTAETGPVEMAGYGVRNVKILLKWDPYWRRDVLIYRKKGFVTPTRPAGFVRGKVDGKGLLLYSLGARYGGYPRFLLEEGKSIPRRGLPFVNFSALPAPNWKFDGWTGQYLGTTIDTPTHNYTLLGGLDDGDLNVVAHFSPLETYSLDVSSAGQGSVYRSPDLPAYGRQMVSVHATPSPGWIFEGWEDISSGELVASSPYYKFLLDRNRSLRAVFRKRPVLKVDVQGEGHVTRSPNAVEYTPGQAVLLTPVPAEGWEFHGWEGDLTGSDTPATLTMDGAKQVTAVFKPILNLSVDINNNGSDTDDDDFEPGGSKENEAPPGGEYIRAYDSIDNGIGYGYMSRMSTYMEPTTVRTWISRCDDLQPIRLSLGRGGATSGVVSMTVTAEEGTPPTLHFLSAERVERGSIWGPEFEDEIEFPYDIEREGPLPNKLYLLAEGPATGYSKFLLTFKYESGTLTVPSGEDTLRMTAISGPGAPNYFTAAQDYMAETGASYFTESKEYTPEMVPGTNLSSSMRFLIMDQSKTIMTALDAYNATPRLFGIRDVAAKFPQQTVAISGNYSWNVVRIEDNAYNSWGFGCYYATRCDGLLVHEGEVASISTYEGAYEEQGLDRPAKQYHSHIAQTINRGFVLKQGKVEDQVDRADYRDALGGLVIAEALGYGPDWVNKSNGPRLFIGEAPASPDKEVLFIVCSEFQWLSEYKTDAVRLSGKAGAGQDVFSSGAPCVFFLDGDSSVALAYKKPGPNEVLKPRTWGFRHWRGAAGWGREWTQKTPPTSGGPVGFYYIPTYLVFNSAP